ncbi:MAG: hypothetical protein WCR51_12345 [Planctomycetia bacterium]
MFIEQSAARRRVVRMLFLLAAVLPCGVLAAAAWWRHSAAHVAGVGQDASAHLGLPVSVGAIVHPRPGVRRLSQVTVGGSARGDALAVPELEVETAAGEVRVRVPRLECSPEAARLLAGIAGEWLSRPARFPAAWVVDVGEVTWLPTSAVHGRAPVGWHLECVAVDDSRAVRCRREPSSVDDVRVRSGPDGLVVEGDVREAIPVAILAAIVPGFSGWADAVGAQAVVRGSIDALSNADGWSGTIAGTIEHAALDGVMAGGGGRAHGEATITVTTLRFTAGRIVACDMLVSASAGTLPQGLLEGLVGSLGCRPGPAYRSIAGDPVRRFDRLACRIVFGDGVLSIRSAEGRGGSLISAQGLSLIDEPPDGVPATRLAWFLSPGGGPAVPASPASAWLMSVLPESGGESGGF